MEALAAVQDAAEALERSNDADNSLSSFVDEGFASASHRFQNVHFGADQSCYFELSDVEHVADDLAALVEFSKTRCDDNAPEVA